MVSARTVRHAVVVTAFGLVLGACGKSGPCSGGGMTVDDSALAESVKSNGGLPPGAVACRDETMAPSPTNKPFELGKNVDEGFEGSVRHFVANGWALVSQVPANGFRNAVFVKDDTRMKLGCSLEVEGKGWCNFRLESMKR